MNAATILVLLGLISSAIGHAVLVTPTPWNAQPSKTSPCGAGTPSTVAATTLVAGSKVSLIWKVIAADGEGVTSLLFDSKGGINFTNPIVLGTTDNTITFTFNFTVPALTCTGPGGLCTMQVKSASNWFSCSTILIVPANTTTPPAPPPKPTCTVVSNLNFCTSRNNINITIPAGQTAANVDTEIASTYAANIVNPNVFVNGNNTDCQAAYALFICNNFLPGCTYNASCVGICQQMLNLCVLTPQHVNLYTCGPGGPPDCIFGSSAAGPSSASPAPYYPPVYTSDSGQSSQTAAIPAGAASLTLFGALLLAAQLFV